MDALDVSKECYFSCVVLDEKLANNPVLAMFMDLVLLHADWLKNK